MSESHDYILNKHLNVKYWIYFIKLLHGSFKIVLKQTPNTRISL
jgi:hypothetical protein